MVRFRIVDGAMWQWDTGRKIAITCEASARVDEVHFSSPGSTSAIIVLPKLYDGEYTADIPNILLKSPGAIEVYAVIYTDTGERTYAKYAANVKQRQQPDDYVYTETETLNYSTLNKRMDEMEASAEQAIRDSVSLALAEAKESGEFDGKDYVLTQADKEEIADMASDEWVDIADITTTEEVNSFYFNADKFGNAFSCKKLFATLILPYALSELKAIYFGGSEDYAFEDPYYSFNIVYFSRVRQINTAIELAPDKCVKMDFQMNIETDGFSSSDLPNGSIIKPTLCSDLHGFRISLGWEGTAMFPIGTTLRVWGLKK